MSPHAGIAMLLQTCVMQMEPLFAFESALMIQSASKSCTQLHCKISLYLQANSLA